jgi:hypothetical protein
MGESTFAKSLIILQGGSFNTIQSTIEWDAKHKNRSMIEIIKAMIHDMD